MTTEEIRGLAGRPVLLPRCRERLDRRNTQESNESGDANRSILCVRTKSKSHPVILNELHRAATIPNQIRSSTTTQRKELALWDETLGYVEPSGCKMTIFKAS